MPVQPEHASFLDQASDIYGREKAAAILGAASYWYKYVQADLQLPEPISKLNLVVGENTGLEAWPQPIVATAPGWETISLTYDPKSKIQAILNDTPKAVKHEGLHNAHLQFQPDFFKGLNAMRLPYFTRAIAEGAARTYEWGMSTSRGPVFDKMCVYQKMYPGSSRVVHGLIDAIYGCKDDNPDPHVTELDETGDIIGTHVVVLFALKHKLSIDDVVKVPLDDYLDFTESYI